MAWIFADQSFGTGSKNPLTGSNSYSYSASFIQSARTIDAPPEHGSFYSQSAQSQLKYIQSKVGGQEVLTTSSPTFQNMTVTGSLRAGAFVVTSSQTSYTASFGSGRSIFGDTPDDQHSLTGSLEISGGLEFLHYGFSGSNESSMSIGQFAGSGSGIQNVQVPQTDHIPLNTWKGSVTALQLPSGSRSTQPPGQRGIMAGGYASPVNIDVIEFVTISTPSDASDFGDLTAARRGIAGMSNGINDRAAFAGGRATPVYNIIDYITISTAGNAIDFGDLYCLAGLFAPAGASNGPNERGLAAGGDSGVGDNQNAIEYITISTTGNSNDFGDLTEERYYAGGTDSGINDRAIFFGATPATDTIDFVTISTTGNAHFFGNLTQVRSTNRGTSNDLNNRAVIAGDNPNTNIIEFITIDSTGDAQDFGDMTVSRGNLGMTSNGTDERGISAGGTTPETNIIDYITISVLGNALDFGDSAVMHESPAAASNAATSDWPYENAFDQIKLYTSASAATALADRTEQTNLTGSYLSRFSGSASHPLDQHSGSSQTFVEEIASGSLTLSSNRPPGNIGVFAYGATGMDFFQINSPGNAVDFGSTSQNKETGMSNGILGRGITADGKRTLRYITLTTPGAAFFFGNIGPGRIEAFMGQGGTSNGPLNRGMVGMGYIRPVELGRGHLEYITISTLADSLHFGDSSNATRRGTGLSNGVGDRAIFFGGDSYGSHMSVVTVSTPSDGVFFGNGLNTTFPGGLSNDTGERGIQVAGGDGSPRENTIMYITLTSFGDACDFGDTLTDFRRDGVSNGRGNRAVMGASTCIDVATMEFITINSPGNSIDFGDLTDSNGGAEGYGAGMDNGQSFYPHAAYPQMRFSTDPMTVIQSKTEVSFASGSLQHYIASGGLFSTPIITPSGSHTNLTGSQSGSNSFVQNFPEGATGRTGIFEVWAGLVPDQVANLTGSSPAFTQLALGYNATGSIGSLHGFSGSSAFYASASVYNAYNVSASFSSGSSATSDSASAGRIAATALPGTNTIYRGEWKTIASGSVLPGQRGVMRGTGTLGFQYITISTTGNATDFGDGVHNLHGASGTTNGIGDRGITQGGNHKDIEYITLSTPSDAIDFGNYTLVDLSYGSNGTSNGPDDRGLMFNSSTGIEYVTISSCGDGVEFGTSLMNTGGYSPCMSNGVNQRTLRSAGYNWRKQIEAYTVNSRGNGWYFGDSLDYTNNQGETGTSNDTDQRGVKFGGYYLNGGGQVNTIDYVTISTLGNSLSFGDTLAVNQAGAACSNGIDGRAVFGGGSNTLSAVEYVSLSTPADTVDFGDLIVAQDANYKNTFLDNGATPMTVSGSSVSVGPTFFSGSIAYASGSTTKFRYDGVNYWDLTRGTGPITGSGGTLVQASALSTGSMVVVTDRIMNSTGSSQVSASVDYGALVDFSAKTLPGQRGVSATHDATNIEYITIDTLGNSAVFGDLTNITDQHYDATSNGTGQRGIILTDPTMEFITISTTGNSTHFSHDGPNTFSALTSNGTDQRAVLMRSTGYAGTIRYYTISTLGNATDYAGKSSFSSAFQGGISNGRNDRGIFFGRYPAAAAGTDYMTISSGGNSLRFGNETWSGDSYGGALSNDTDDRGILFDNNSTIRYITISTPSDSIDFGDSAKLDGDTTERATNQGFSNGIGNRGIMGLRTALDLDAKAITYITINSLGNAVEFGERITQAGYGSPGTSNSAL